MAPVIAGALSGQFQGMPGMGGPPLPTYLKTRGLTKHPFRPTLKERAGAAAFGLSKIAR